MGTAGNDQIVGDQGSDLITSGGGRDDLVYKRLQDAGDTITDFEVGSDEIVLTDLLDGLSYGASNAIQDGYVQLAASGSGTDVQLDPDGPTGDRTFRSFLQVEGVSPADLSDASNFAF